MTRIGLAALLLAIVLAGPAFAQRQPARPAASETTRAAPQRVKNIAIEEDVLRGEILLPLGERRHLRRPAEHGGLIEVRADFVREIVRSADDV